MSNRKADIDIEDALKRALGDAAFLQMMFEEFQTMIPEFLEAIQSDIEENDMDALGKNAHQLKGAAANLSVKDICATALKLEKIGKSGQADQAEAALKRLKEAAANFDQFMTQMNWVSLAK